MPAAASFAPAALSLRGLNAGLADLGLREPAEPWPSRQESDVEAAVGAAAGRGVASSFRNAS